MTFKGVKRAEVVTRILGFLALFQIAHTFWCGVIDTNFLLRVVLIGVDWRVVLPNCFIISIEQIGNPVDLLLCKLIVVVLQ